MAQAIISNAPAKEVSFILPLLSISYIDLLMQKIRKYSNKDYPLYF